jgi:phosphohistidine phosphatase SixA
MQKELAQMRRRPLFVPLLAPVLFVALAAMAAIWFLDARSTTVVIVVRHAETEAGDDPDRGLSDAGRERALRLAHMLSQAKPVRGIDAIYASDLKRTQQTVIPLAEMMGLPVTVRPAESWKKLAATIRSEHRGQFVVAAGHANTIPELIAGLTGQNVAVSEDEYDALFVVFVPRFCEPRLLRLKY